MAFVNSISRLDDLAEYIRTISVASDIGIEIDGASGQSGDYIRVLTDTAGAVFKLLGNGDVGIGTTPTTSNVHILKTRTDTSGTVRGLRTQITTQPGADSSATFSAFEANLNLDQGNNYTGQNTTVQITASHLGLGTVTTVSGIKSSVVEQGGGTITSAIGGSFFINISSVAGTITNAIAQQNGIFNSISGGTMVTSECFRALAPNVVAGTTIGTNTGYRVRNQGNSVITTSYAILIDPQSGSGTNYAIGSQGGQSLFQAGVSTNVILTLQGAASQSADQLEVKDSNGNIVAYIAANGDGKFSPLDAVTNAITTALMLGHNSSGTPAVGFGNQIQFLLKSSTTIDQNSVDISTEWATATHASRKARFKIGVYDTAVRECFRAEASGTAPMIGFLGAAAVIRTAAYTVTNPTTDRALNVTADTLAQGLQVLGTLISDLQGFGLLG